MFRKSRAVLVAATISSLLIHSLPQEAEIVGDKGEVELVKVYQKESLKVEWGAASTAATPNPEWSMTVPENLPLCQNNVWVEHQDETVCFSDQTIKLRTSPLRCSSYFQTIDEEYGYYNCLKCNYGIYKRDLSSKEPLGDGVPLPSPGIDAYEVTIFKEYKDTIEQEQQATIFFMNYGWDIDVNDPSFDCLQVSDPEMVVKCDSIHLFNETSYCVGYEGTVEVFPFETTLEDGDSCESYDIDNNYHLYCTNDTEEEEEEEEGNV